MNLENKRVLVAHGDSFTQGVGFPVIDGLPQRVEIEYPWPKLLTKDLGMECVNFGKEGMSNEGIARDLLYYLSQTKENFKDLFDEKNLLKIAYLNGVQVTIDLLIFSIFVEYEVDLNLVEKQINFLENSEIPIFPIKTDYLKLQYGFSESKELGDALKKLKEFWIDHNFKIDKKEIEKILKLK